MKRAHVSPLLLVLTAVISLSCGIGITLAAEDWVGVPMNAVDAGEISVPEDLLDMTLDKLIEWAENHPDVLNDVPDWLIESIKDKIANGDYSIDDLEELLSNHPELAGALEDYISDYINNLKEEEEAAEPYSTGSPVMSVDQGTFDPEENQQEVFTFDSSYRGEVHIRTQSYGDYLYGNGSFAPAPEFDDSIYMVSPLLYAGRAFESANYKSETLTFHLSNSLDYGMPVGDYSGTSYTPVGGTNTPFSKSTESRVRRFDSRDYTVTFYPDDSPGDAALPSYLEADESNYYAFARKNYRNVPSELTYALETFLDKNSLANPKQVENLFKTRYTYEAQAFNPIGDPVQYFLESGEKVGTCTNFASAMTLICRQLGYPSRMVGGYYVSAVAGSNSVKASSAHAWVEVYSAGYGWVRYDPTPASNAEEAEQNGGSKGETGDPAFDPECVEKEEENETLFSFKTSYYGDVYLRSASFLDYDPSTSTFALDNFAAEESSLLYASNAVGGDWNPSGYLITMYMGDRRDTGMIFASYPSTHYAEGEAYDFYSLEEEMRPVSDGRFFREDISTYTYAFYPDSYFTYGVDDDSYYYNYIDYYRNLPGDYYNLLSSFCADNNVYSLDDLITFFSKECEIDNSLTNQKGDAIEYFLNTSHKGNSSVFAGAYTLLARYLGTPARFVSGYKAASSSFARTNVKESDTYYWVETYVKGYGWQKVDPIALAGLKTRPVDPIKITLSLEFEGEYDGVARMPGLEDIKVTSGELFEGDSIYEVSFPTGLQPQYCFDLDGIPFGGVKIKDKKGKDVTESYSITYDSDTVYHVSKKTITVETFDCTIQSANEVTVTENDLGGVIIQEGLAEGDTYEISYPTGTLGKHSVGDKFENNPTIRIINASGEDVTYSCYVINYVYGTVKIVSSGE